MQFLATLPHWRAEQLPHGIILDNPILEDILLRHIHPNRLVYQIFALYSLRLLRQIHIPHKEVILMRAQFPLDIIQQNAVIIRQTPDFLHHCVPNLLSFYLFKRLYALFR